MSENGAAPEPKPDPLDAASGLLTKVGAMVAAAVAINAGVTGFFNESIARTNAFKDAVRGEEQFWGGLHNDYVSTFDPVLADALELRAAKRIALCSLSNREAADFREYPVSAGVRDEATQRVAAMRVFLRSALLSPGVSGADVARQCRANAYDVEQQAQAARATDSRTEGAPPPPAAAVTVPGAIFETEIISTGRKNGWDIDVFWCQGDNEDENRAAARRAAVKLSAGPDQLAPEVLRGVVQLRGFPVDRQAAAGIPPGRTFVAWDNGRGEEAAAEAVRQRLNDGPTELVFGKANTVERTLWRLSVFVCTAPPAPPAVPPPP